MRAFVPPLAHKCFLLCLAAALIVAGTPTASAAPTAPSVMQTTPEPPADPSISIPLSARTQQELDRARQEIEATAITETMRQEARIHLDAAESRFSLEADGSLVPMGTAESTGESEIVHLNADILFDFGSADVRPEAAAKLTDLLTPIPESGTVQVNGHTDAIGSEQDNLTLSQQRADAVARVIAQIRPDLSLSVQGFGETSPIAENTHTDGTDNPLGRAHNRRVDIIY